MRLLVILCTTLALIYAKGTPKLTFAMGTAGALTLPLLEKNRLTLDSQSTLFDNSIVPLNDNAFFAGHAPDAPHEALAVQLADNHLIPPQSMRDASTTTIGPTQFQHRLVALKERVERGLIGDYALAALEVMRLREYNNDAFLLAFGDVQLDSMPDFIAAHPLSRNLQLLRQSVLHLPLQGARVRVLAYRGLVDLKAFLGFDNIVTADQLADRLGDEIAGADAIIARIEEFGKKGGRITRSDFELFQQALNAIEGDLRLGIQQFYAAIELSHEPAIAFTADDRKVMQNSLPVVLASSHVNTVKWQKGTGDGEAYSPHSLRIGKELDVMATRREYCSQLERWVRHVKLESEVTVLFYDDYGRTEFCHKRSWWAHIKHLFRRLISSHKQ